MRKYAEEALKFLEGSSETTTSYGTQVLLKKTDLYRKGHVDAYEMAYENPDPAPAPTALPTTPMEVAGMMRDLFGCHNYNLNEREIYTEKEELTVEGRKVGLWRYYLRRRKTDLRPCLMYIHGGGWVAGSIYAVENPCKLVAELADAVVFNVDYSLSPEVAYPVALNQLWSCLKHIYENAGQYGIDPKRIMVAGDSAGGNLTAALALKDRDEGTHMIARQFMLYPAVVLGTKTADGYLFDETAFDISPEEMPRVAPALGLGRPAKDKGENGEEENADGMAALYVQNPARVNEPYVSPMLAESFEGLAPAVITTAEYDGLRLQGEFYAGQLRKAGVPVRVLRYTGSFHAYLDRLGYVPQSEDVCREMAKELSNMTVGEE